MMFYVEGSVFGLSVEYDFDMFFTDERKCIVSLPAVAVGLKGGGEARGVLPFCNTHASMVKPESGGSVF